MGVGVGNHQREFGGLFSFMEVVNVGWGTR